MCKFENQCNHKPESFYGTVTIEGKEGDLYFYKSHDKWEYCFRTGPDGEYRSFPIDTLYRFVKGGDTYESQIIEYFIAYMNVRF